MDYNLNNDYPLFDSFDELREIANNLDTGASYDNNSIPIPQNNEEDKPIITLADIRKGKVVETNLGSVDIDSYDIFSRDKQNSLLADLMTKAMEKNSNKGEVFNPFKEQEIIPDDGSMTENDKAEINGRIKLVQNMTAIRTEIEEDWKGASQGRRKRLSDSEKEAFQEFFGDDWEEVMGTSKKKDKDDPAKKYEARFKPRLRELEKLSDEVSEYTDMIVSNVKELYKSRAKGSMKLITDSSATVSSLLSTKLSIIDKKIGITKTIEELTLKSVKGSGDGLDDNFIIDQVMSKIMGKTPTTLSMDDAVNLLNNEDYDSQVNAAMANIEGLVANGDLQFTDSEKALQYQHLNPTITVLADPSTKEWQFICIGDDGQEIPDYPLPSKELAKMDIDWDYGQYAKDKNSGITYSVLFNGAY